MYVPDSFPLAVDKNEGFVKTQLSCSVFVTPRVARKKVRTKPPGISR
jgi:hypothetical protein